MKKTVKKRQKREEKMETRDRSIITIAELYSAGLYPQLKAN